MHYLNTDRQATSRTALNLRITEPDLRVFLLAAASLLSMPASSAESPSSNAAPLLEVIVTAAKRAENPQDVPPTITAITDQTIEQTGIVNFFDYAIKVPNLTFASGHGIVDARTIRGIRGGGTTGFYRSRCAWTHYLRMLQRSSRKHRRRHRSSRARAAASTLSYNSPLRS
jgi:outer membrane receptor protein involved in Fe transport